MIHNHALAAGHVSQLIPLLCPWQQSRALSESRVSRPQHQQVDLARFRDIRNGCFAPRADILTERPAPKAALETPNNGGEIALRLWSISER